MDGQIIAHVLATLGRVEGKIDAAANLAANHAPRLEAAEKRAESNERRILQLEADKWKLVGASAAMGGICAVAGALLPILFR